MKVKDLSIGQVARVVGHGGDDTAYRHKLLRMGLVKGAEFTLKRKAPMGDPVELELKGANFSLRKSEADALEITVVSGK